MGYSGWIAAATGYFFTYYNDKLQNEREARIQRVNNQLRDFYGPLLACVTATKSAYDAMVKQHSPDGTTDGMARAVAQHPEGEQARAYRSWMKEVLQPLNERAATIITEHIDLLESATVEPALLQLLAHVCSCRVILTRWQEGELATQSVISYPDTLAEWVQTEFGRMKRRQAELLGAASPVRAKL